MKARRFARLALLGLALVAASLRLGQAYDPHAREVRRVQSRLRDLASAASFKESDPPFARLGYGGRLTDFFAESTELAITLGTRMAHESVSRAALRDGANGLRATNRGLHVEFIDIQVDLSPSAPAASAHLTSKIYFLGDPDYFVQEFRIELERTAEEWKVRRIATIRTME